MKKSELLEVLSFIKEFMCAGPQEVTQKTENGLYLYFSKDGNSFSNGLGHTGRRNLCIVAVGIKMSQDQIEKVCDAFDVRFNCTYPMDVIDEQHNVGREYLGYVFCDRNDAIQ